MAESLQKKKAVYRRMDQCGWRDYENPTENAFALRAEKIKQEVIICYINKGLKKATFFEKGK